MTLTWQVSDLAIPCPGAPQAPKQADNREAGRARLLRQFVAFRQSVAPSQGFQLNVTRGARLSVLNSAPSNTFGFEVTQKRLLSAVQARLFPQIEWTRTRRPWIWAPASQAGGSKVSKAWRQARRA